eukprot:scaffold439_cov415-Prasinococcus_capsulatus_cf.AAC.56
MTYFAYLDFLNVSVFFIEYGVMFVVWKQPSQSLDERNIKRDESDVRRMETVSHLISGLDNQLYEGLQYFVVVRLHFHQYASPGGPGVHVIEAEQVLQYVQKQRGSLRVLGGSHVHILDLTTPTHM